MKGKTRSLGRTQKPARQTDLHRLAADLAAEWCCRHDEFAPAALEVTP